MIAWQWVSCKPFASLVLHTRDKCSCFQWARCIRCGSARNQIYFHCNALAYLLQSYFYCLSVCAQCTLPYFASCGICFPDSRHQKTSKMSSILRMAAKNEGANKLHSFFLSLDKLNESTPTADAIHHIELAIWKFICHEPAEYTNANFTQIYGEMFVRKLILLWRHINKYLSSFFSLRTAYGACTVSL